MAFLSMTRVLYLLPGRELSTSPASREPQEPPILKIPRPLPTVVNPSRCNAGTQYHDEPEFVLLTAGTVCPLFMRGYDAGAGDETSLAMAKFGGIDSMLLISHNSAPIYTG